MGLVEAIIIVIAIAAMGSAVSDTETETQASICLVCAELHTKHNPGDGAVGEIPQGGKP